KRTSFSFFTFYINVAVVVVYYPFYIGQPQSMPFYIMYIACMFSVKLLENPLLSGFRHTQPLIGYFNENKIFYILCINIYNRLILRIFNGIIQNINQYIGKVHIV